MSYWEMYCRFYVCPDVMVPRRSSECLVSTAISHLTSQSSDTDSDRVNPTVSVLDLGTGSGCLLLSIVKGMQSVGTEKQVIGVGIDMSKEALDVARENSLRLGVDDHTVFLSHSFNDLKTVWEAVELSLANSTNSDSSGGIGSSNSDSSDSKAGSTSHVKAFVDAGSLNGFDVIVCNPPYSTLEEVSRLSDSKRCYEPAQALFTMGNSGPLGSYANIAQAILGAGIEESTLPVVKKGTLPVVKKGTFFIFEIGSSQSHAVKTLYASVPTLEYVEEVLDFNGLVRCIVFKYV